MVQSGRRQSQEAEQRRRQGTAYGNALAALEGVGRKKSVTATFHAYFVAMMQSLSVRAEELVSTARSVVRWQQKRSLSRFIGRLCDRLFDRTSEENLFALGTD